MEAIKSALFNSPTKKTNASMSRQKAPSRPSQSKPSAGYKPTANKKTTNNTRNNNLVASQNKIHIKGEGLDRIQILGSGQIQQTQRQPFNLSSLGQGQLQQGPRPPLRINSPAQIHQGPRPPLRINSTAQIPPGLRPPSNLGSQRYNPREFVIQTSPSQIHQGSRAPASQSSPSQGFEGMRPPVNVNFGVRPSVNVKVSGSGQVYDSSRLPGSRSSMSRNFVKVMEPPGDPDEASMLKKVVIPALYSLKELALKKKKMRVGPQKTDNSKIVPNNGKKDRVEEKEKSYSNCFDSKSQGKITERQFLEANSPYRSLEINKVVADKESPYRSLEINNKVVADNEWIQTVEDDDSDIEVEEINVVSKQTQPIIAPSQSGNDVVISTIMKQVADLENTLKNNVAKKDSELKVERQIVEQLKKKNQTLELRDKKRKEAMEQKDSEVAKAVENKNNEIKQKDNIINKMAEEIEKGYKEIETLRQSMEQRDNKAAKEIEKKNNEIKTMQLTMKSFSDSMAEKLNQKEKEIDTIQSVSRKNSDFMSKKVTQKQEELTALGKTFGKVSSELEDLQKWRSTQVLKEKEAFTKLIQGNLAKDKQRIETLEKNIKGKDDLIVEHEKSIESLTVKIGERDGLVQDLKSKVSKLITEFTKTFKDKDEQLNSKIEEINENSSEIRKLSRTIINLENIISSKEKEIEILNRTIFDINKKHAITVLDLKQKHAITNEDISKKLSIAEHWISLHSVKQQEAEDIIESLEKSNSDYAVTIKQLQNKLSKLKIVQANGLTIKNEDIFEDKLEEFLYDFYENKQKTEQLMLTYSWPAISVHIDPRLLQQSKNQSKEKSIPVIFIAGKPLMVTYLWPVLPFQHKVIQKTIKCRGVQAKFSTNSINIPVEQVKIFYNIPEFIDATLYRKATDVIECTHNWPVVAINEVINHKRKFEESTKREAKRIKIDYELKSHQDELEDFVSAIVDDIVEYSENHATDIIANPIEKSGNIVKKDWPIITYSPPVSLLKTVEQVKILDDLAEYMDNSFVKKATDVTGVNHVWPVVSFNDVINRKRKFEEFVKNQVKRMKLDPEDDFNKVEHAGKHAMHLLPVRNTGLLKNGEINAQKDWPMVVYSPLVSLPKTTDQISILDDVAESIGTTGRNNNWPVVSVNQVINSKRKFEESMKNEAKRIKLETEFISRELNMLASSILNDIIYTAENHATCIVKENQFTSHEDEFISREDELNKLVSSILDDILNTAENHAKCLSSDIVKDLIEKRQAVAKKDWPIITSSPFDFLEGTMKMYSGTCKGTKSKKFSIEVSTKGILKLNPTFLIKTLYFSDIPKEFNFVVKLELEKGQKITEITWPMMIYKENSILKNVIYLSEVTDDISKNIGAAAPVESLFDWDCEKTKRKLENNLDLVYSKRLRLCDHKDGIEERSENIEEISENGNSIEDLGENVDSIEDQLIYEMIDYVVTFSEIKSLLM